MSERSDKQGILLIVSGPAGSGKTTLCERMLAEEPAIRRVVTSTTRPPRAGERDREDYYFFDHETFERKVASGEFYEHAKVHNNRYGTLKSEIQDKIEAGFDLLLNIDVQGAATFREAARTDALLGNRLATVFILTPDLDELAKRLQARGTDDEAEIARRLEVAREELAEWTRYDYAIRSRSKEADFERLQAIYRAEKLRVR